MRWTDKYANVFKLQLQDQTNIRGQVERFIFMSKELFKT